MAQSDNTTGTRPEQIGPTLRRAREMAGMNERRAARSLGVDRHLLRAWEAGSTTPDTDDVARAVRLYGADLERIWPDRTPLVTSEDPGVLVVGTEKVAVEGDNRTILARYLTAVRRQRGVAADDPIELRAEDISGLATVLDLDDADLETALAELLGLTPTGARFTMRALVVGALMAVGASSLIAGGWVLDQPDVAAAADAPGSTATTTTEVAPSPHGPTISVEALTVEAPTAKAPGQTTERAAETAERPSPFSTEPSSAAVELAPAMFAVAPATEWSPRPTEMFSTQPNDRSVVTAPADQVGPGAAGELPSAQLPSAQLPSAQLPTDQPPAD